MGGRVSDVAFDASSGNLAISTPGAGLFIWSRGRAAVSKIGSLTFDGDPLVRFAPSGEILVAAESVELWNAATGGRRRLHTGPSHVFDAGFLTPELIYVAENQLLRVVDSASAREVASFRHEESLVVAADGAAGVLVVGGPFGIRSFAVDAALGRSELRRQLVANDFGRGDEGLSRHLALLASWYETLGWPVFALRYIREHGFDDRMLPALTLARIRRSANDVPGVDAALAQARARGEVSETFAALLARSARKTSRGPDSKRVNAGK